MARAADGERGERARVGEEEKWRTGEAMGTPMPAWRTGGPWAMLKAFEPRENVCLYLCLYNLWSSWALL